MEYQQSVFDWIMAVAGVLTVVFGALYAFKRLGTGEENRFRQDILEELRTVKEDHKALQKEHMIALGKLANLEANMRLMEKELQAKAQLFESAHSHLPVPMWLKDLDGKMLALNDAYEQVFLRPQGKSRDDYIGFIDHDVWPDDIADQFVEHDNQVLHNDIIWRGIETMPDMEGIHERWHIIKYVRKVNGIKIGIGGLAIDLEVMEKQIA